MHPFKFSVETINESKFDELISIPFNGVSSKLASLRLQEINSTFLSLHSKRSALSSEVSSKITFSSFELPNMIILRIDSLNLVLPIYDSVKLLPSNLQLRNSTRFMEALPKLVFDKSQFTKRTSVRSIRLKSVFLKSQFLITVLYSRTRSSTSPANSESVILHVSNSRSSSKKISVNLLSIRSSGIFGASIFTV